MAQEYDIGREFAPLPEEYPQAPKPAAAVPSKKKHNMCRLLLALGAAVILGNAVHSGANPEEPVEIPQPPAVTEVTEPAATTAPTEPPELLRPLLVLEEQMGDGDLFTQYTVYSNLYDPQNHVMNYIIEEGVILGSEFSDAESIPLPEPPQADGYRFLGWVMLVKTGEDVHFVALENGITQEKLLLLPQDENSTRHAMIYAAWARDGAGEESYLLTLDANGGSFGEEERLTFDAQPPLLSSGMIYLCAYPAPQREGYLFAGWYTSPAEEGALAEVIHGTEFYALVDGQYDWNTQNPVTVYAGWAKP